MLRILIDARTIKKNPSGVGTWCLRLVGQLVKRKDYDISLLLPKDCTYDFTQDNDLSPTHNKNLHVHFSNHHYTFVSLGRLLYEQIVLPFLIFKTRPHIYLSSDSFGIPLVMPSKTKSIVTVHDLIPLTPYREFMNQFHYLIYKLSLAITFHKANKVVAISEKTKIDLEHFFPHLHDIEVIHDGVDVVERQASDITEKVWGEIEHSYKLHTKKYFLYYGGFGKRRNIETLIDVFTLLCKQNIISADWKLVLSGRVKNAKKQSLEVLNELKIRLKANGIEDRVVILDYLEHSVKYTLITHAWAFISLTNYEGFGLAAAESINHNTYSFTSQSGIWYSFPGSNMFVVEENQNAKIVSDRIINVLQAKDSEVMHDFEMIRSFVAGFTWKKMAEKYIELFDRMCR